MFWTRDTGLTPAQIAQQADQLRDMPVQNTSYLLDEGESFLVSVPFRWRN